MRSNAYTNCYEFMFVLSKGKPKTFNPIKEDTVRNGFEMLVHNKKAGGVNKKVLKELKKEKTKTNIWKYAVGFGGTTWALLKRGYVGVYHYMSAQHLSAYITEYSAGFNLPSKASNGDRCNILSSVI